MPPVELTPAQWNQLLQLIRDIIPTLRQIAAPSYTITGAQDWGMMVSMFVIIGLLVTAVGVLVKWVHFNIISTIKDNKTEREKALDKLEKDYKAADKTIWDAIELCQDRCCGYGRRKEDKTNGEGRE